MPRAAAAALPALAAAPANHTAPPRAPATAAAVAVHTGLRYDGTQGGCGVGSGCPSCPCMDLYLPEAAPPDLPVMLLLHGGLWYSGRRGELGEVCRAIAESGAAACVTADYEYSQDLGGCCEPGCFETYTKQAARVIEARAFLYDHWRPAVDPHKLYIGGHSAGGHLSVALAMRWGAYTEYTPPLGAISVSGIHDVPVWVDYDASRWGGQFACVTKQAFGQSAAEAREGSPTLWAASERPHCPLLLIHSPGDDWVQARQASDLYAALLPARGHRAAPHEIDVAGRCAHGQHNDVLRGASARALAACILAFAAAAR